MTDRPILFSAPMVRALIDGRKTQTRRVLKPQPQYDGEWWRLGDIIWQEASFPVFDGQEMARRARFAPGDRLWVRENFTTVPTAAYRMSKGVERTICHHDPDWAAIYAEGWERSKPRWRPSIHMPRWASRLTLVVESVKVERLQEISEEDAQAEGAQWEDCWPTYRQSFEALWTRINGRDSWSENPWVAAVSFCVIKSNIDRLGG